MVLMDLFVYYGFCTMIDGAAFRECTAEGSIRFGWSAFMALALDCMLSCLLSVGSIIFIFMAFFLFCFCFWNGTTRLHFQVARELRWISFEAIEVNKLDKLLCVQ